VRLGSELHAVVASAAAAEGVSINSWIVQALRAESGG
jgi:predicted HicB family RNase H-like nuclease